MPQLKIYCNGWTGWLTKVLRIGAITVGHRIFVSPKFSTRNERTGQIHLPGWLVAHEAVHVLQYQREGILRFLANYLREYVQTLIKARRFGAGARTAAYYAISHEVEAHIAEQAYHRWSEEKRANQMANKLKF